MPWVFLCTRLLHAVHFGLGPSQLLVRMHRPQQVRFPHLPIYESVWVKLEGIPTGQKEVRFTLPFQVA